MFGTKFVKALSQKKCFVVYCWMSFFFVFIIIFTLKHILSVNLFFFFAVKIIEPYKNARHSLVNSPKGIVILYKTVIDFCAV